jgi:hypothetical protein
VLELLVAILGALRASVRPRASLVTESLALLHSARGLTAHAQDFQVRAAAMKRAATKTQLRDRGTHKLAERSSHLT